MRTSGAGGGAPLPLWFASVLSLLGGGLYVLAVPRFDVAPLGWIGLVPLFVAVEGASFRRVLWCAWLVGLVTNIGGFPWITGLLVRFGNIPMPLAMVLHLLLGAWQALMFPVAALAATWLRRSGLPFAVAWLAGWLLSDYLFPMVFPWYLAMGQYRFLPLIQAADVVGVAGVTSLVVAINAGAYLLVLAAARSPRAPAWLPSPATIGRREATWTAAAIAVTVAAALAYGWVQVRNYDARRARADKVPFGIVQPNVGIREKRDFDLHLLHLARMQAMTSQAERRGALVAVWPESAYPGGLTHDPPPDGSPPRDLPEGHPYRIRRGFSIPLVFGAISRGADPPRRYNSTFVLDADGRLHGPADKNVLLVFGEYIPLRDWLGFLDRWFPRAGSMAAGRQPGLLPMGNLTLGILNCYEDILPGYVRRLMLAGAPHVLVNVTNDAWFGDSAEPHQHLALAVFRCVEQRREMVRSVNTGVSAHVAATGELLVRTPTFRRVVFVAGVVPYAGRTVYAMVGDRPGYAALALAGAWALWRRRRAA